MIEAVIDQFDKDTDITVIVNYMGELIDAYLGSKHKIVKEPKYLGTAGALRLLDMKTDFIVTNCDILVNIDYVKLHNYHIAHKSDLTIVATRNITHVPFGTFDYDKYNKLLSITEKPSYTHVVNTGFYMFNPSILELIEGFMDMDTLIQTAIEKNKNVYLYHITNDKYTDMGTLKKYKEFIRSYDDKE